MVEGPYVQGFRRCVRSVGNQQIWIRVETCKRSRDIKTCYSSYDNKSSNRTSNEMLMSKQSTEIVISIPDIKTSNQVVVSKTETEVVSQTYIVLPKEVIDVLI